MKQGTAANPQSGLPVLAVSNAPPPANGTPPGRTATAFGQNQKQPNAADPVAVRLAGGSEGAISSTPPPASRAATPFGQNQRQASAADLVAVRLAGGSDLKYVTAGKPCCYGLRPESKAMRASPILRLESKAVAALPITLAKASARGPTPPALPRHTHRSTPAAARGCPVDAAQSPRPA